MKNQAVAKQSPIQGTSRAVLLAIVVAGAATAFGCGRHDDGRSASSTAAAPGTNVAQPASATDAHAVATSAEAAPAGEVAAAASADSLPPDVEASAADTLVAPGKVVEIVALGSDDVAAITLSDGIGKPQPLTYDPEAKVWRVFYRMPIRTRTDHVGLSVTATNGAGRWRRVWVFIGVQREAPVTEPSPTAQQSPEDKP